MTWERWIRPLSTDANTARQEQLVNILSLGGMIGGLAYFLALLLLFFFEGELQVASIIGALLALGMSGLAYRLCRSGRGPLAAIIIVVAASGIGLYAAYARGSLSVSVVVLTTSVVFAGMAIGRRAAWITTIVEFILFVLLVLAEHYWHLYTPPIGHSPTSGIALTAVALGLLTLVTVQTLNVLAQSLQQSMEREAALRAADAEKGELLAELRQRERARQRLVEAVQELGSPVIPLAKGVIAMPLIGAIDSGRAVAITRSLLQGVADHQAEAVLVDITGVAVVDTAVAGALVRAMAGVRLLGAEPVLTGILPEVAQTIVELGLDMSGVVTMASLQEGLRYVLEQGPADQQTLARSSERGIQ
ncbi:MAG: STAS domain-containing protein [Chloroflexia bacterium]|nr:STAS domain-containing protein [Chloroflexia bacterium]